MKTSIAYLTMLCCYVYYIDDSEKAHDYSPFTVRIC